MRALLLLPIAALGAVGCGVEQPPECERYVACQAAYDAAFGIEPKTPTEDYAEGGRCWAGNPTVAERCVESCERATASLAAAAAAGGKPLDVCEG